MDWTTFKKYSKRIWRFLAHEDSWASFVADAIIIILLGKFVILPLLGLAMGTPLPAVAVVTSSMDHRDLEFDAWWQENEEWYTERGFEKSEFEAYRLSDGFKKGDIIIVKGVPFDEIEVGDIVVYESPSGLDIIHRVVWRGEDKLGTKGDANTDQLYFERWLEEEQVKGRAVSRVPKLGWVKVVFVDAFDSLK